MRRRVLWPILWAANLSLLLSPSARADELWTLGPCATGTSGEAAVDVFRLSEQQAVARVVDERRYHVATFPPAEHVSEWLAKLDAGSLRFQVTEVARWTAGSRCLPGGTSEALYVVQVFEEPAGREITRAAVSEEAVKIMDRSREEERWLAPLPALRVPERLIPARQAQYVETYGPGTRCSQTTPCIAFKSGEDAYLAADGQLFRLRALPGITWAEQFPTPAARTSLFADYRGRSERILTLAGDGVGIAEPIDQ